jgi:hypothetical protein
MFAYYIGESTYFYDMKFVGKEGQTEKAVQPVCKEVGKLVTMRFFFNKIYGLVETTSPFGYYKNDSSEAFEKRMEKLQLSSSICLPILPI